MKVKFWGVRGSIPTPLSSTQLQSKVAAVVQRIEPHDLETPETREAFLANLPPYLLGTVGGNTTSIEVRLSDDSIIIFDGGSGIRELGISLKKQRERKSEYHIFFSHFHWDHLQGLPFFPPLSDPEAKIFFYSPVERFEEYVRGQMKFPYFPVTLDIMAANLNFIVLKEPPYKIASARVYWRKMKHPGGCYSYQVREGDKRMIFSTDTELSETDFERSEENKAYFQDTDLLIMDSQYTLDEAIEKYDWGHSSFSLAVDFSAEWNIRNLVLFHHEPLYDDKKMFSILKSSGWYLNHLEQKGVKIYLAREGLEVDI